MTFRVHQVRIENLGKLADATIRVGGLTVLAGVNSTGKTFFSKALYSVLSTMDENLLLAGLGGHLMPLSTALYGLPSSSERMPHLGEMRMAMTRMLNTAIFSQRRGVVEETKPLPGFKEAVDEADKAFASLQPEMKNWIGEEESSSPFPPDRNLPARIEMALDTARQVVDMNQLALSLYGLRWKLPGKFKGNFQVTRLADLAGDAGQSVAVHIHDGATFCLTPGGTLAVEGSFLWWHQYSRAIYLSYPAFWQARVALQNARHMRKTIASGGGEEIDGVPQYHHDLEDLLAKGELTSDMPFPQVAERIANVIGGKVVRDDFGHLKFEEDGKSFPLSSTAMGVANLGVLALLIERKLLDPGAFLFIDEPESNLHPEWQVEMTEALWELARGGVNIVIATHSADILKRLDVYAEEERETAESMLAMNHFRRNGTVQSGGAELITDVQEDLSTPFFELYKRAM